MKIIKPTPVTTYDLTIFCCDEMKKFCKPGQSWEQPKAHGDEFKTYGRVLLSSGSYYVEQELKFCPWCGIPIESEGFNART